MVDKNESKQLKILNSLKTDLNIIFYVFNAVS